MKIVLEPWVNTGFWEPHGILKGCEWHCHEVSNAVVETVPRPWRFLRFPCILVIHSHSWRHFDYYFGILQSERTRLTQGLKVLAFFVPSPPHSITKSCQICPQAPPFYTISWLKVLDPPTHMGAVASWQGLLTAQKHNFLICLEIILMKNFNRVWAHSFKKSPVNQPFLISMLLPLIEVREHGNFLAEISAKMLA